MNRRTQAIIGLTLLALGVSVVGLGYLEDEQAVRQVADVVADPAAHESADYILIGIPQPELLTSQDAVAANPLHQNETRWVEAWSQDGTTYHTTHILHVEDGDGSTWTYTNRTQQPGRPDTAVSHNITWQLDARHTVFLIQGFPDANGDTPWIWGVYDGVIRDPVLPKPSQFQGRITHELAGQELPPGAMVYRIDEFTAGCSSKFLPEDHPEGE